MNKKFNWETIGDRIKANQIQQESVPDANETKQIMKLRAQMLAEKPPISVELAETMQVMEFKLGQETYALELRFIDEVCSLKDMTQLPCTPSYVIGIINIRGQIMSVLDIKHFFEIPATKLTGLNKVVILRSDSMEFGILADSIIGPRLIPFSDLQPALSTLTGVRKEYLKGITPDQIVVLDANKILADPSIVVNETG